MPSLILNGNKIGGTVDDATLIRYNNEESTLSSNKIQDAITELDSKVNENLTEAKEYAETVGQEMKDSLLNGAGAAYDTLKELGELIDDNHDAIDALEVVANSKQDIVTGGVTTVLKDNFNANIVPISDANGKITSSNISSTKLGYLTDVTSNIQAQLNGKLSTSGTAAAATKLATARNIQTNLGSTSAVSFNGTGNVTPGVTGTLGIGNGGTGATSAAGIHQNITGNHWTTPAYIDCMGSNGHTGGGGYCSIAELKATMGLNNVNNTADSAKSVKYATSAGSANSVAWGNVSGKPSTFAPSAHGNHVPNRPAGIPLDGNLYLNYSNTWQPVTATQVGALPTNGGTVSGSIILNNGIALKTKNTSGGDVGLIGINTSNNIHINNGTNKVDFYLHNGSGQINFSKTHFCCNTSKSITLGTSSKLWGQIYSSNATISTSDRNEKNDIKELTNIHKQFFMKLIPVSFTFKDGTSGRTHVGFISQDVEQAMKELGMSSLDFAGFCKDIKKIDILDENGDIDYEEDVLDENGNPVYIYSLRYEEFIALNTFIIQDTVKELETVKNKLEDIEKRISSIGL